MLSFLPAHFLMLLHAPAGDQPNVRGIRQGVPLSDFKSVMLALMQGPASLADQAPGPVQRQHVHDLTGGRPSMPLCRRPCLVSSCCLQMRNPRPPHLSNRLFGAPQVTQPWLCGYLADGTTKSFCSTVSLYFKNWCGQRHTGVCTPSAPHAGGCEAMRSFVSHRSAEHSSTIPNMHDPSAAVVTAFSAETLLQSASNIRSQG